MKFYGIGLWIQVARDVLRRVNDRSSDCKLLGGDFNLVDDEWRNFDLRGFGRIPIADGRDRILSLTSLKQVATGEIYNRPDGSWGSNPFDAVLYKLTTRAADTGIPSLDPGRRNYGVFDIVFSANAGQQALRDSMLGVCNSKYAADRCRQLTGYFLGARNISDHLPIYFDVILNELPARSAPPPPRKRPRSPEPSPPKPTLRPRPPPPRPRLRSPPPKVRPPRPGH